MRSRLSGKKWQRTNFPTVYMSSFKKQYIPFLVRAVCVLDMFESTLLIHVEQLKLANRFAHAGSTSEL